MQRHMRGSSIFHGDLQKDNLPQPWLLEQGKVFVKKHLRSSKYNPLVEEADLIEAELQYPHIKFPNGRESTVSIRDLAPLGNSKPPHTNTRNTDEKKIIYTEHTSQLNKPLITDKESLLDTKSNIESPQVQPSQLPDPQVQPYNHLTKGSQRNRRIPQRYGFEDK